MLKGALLADRRSRPLYATDASPHQKLPLAVARPWDLDFRTLLDLGGREGRDRYARMLDEVFELVVRFGGTLSAKHGDGRLRAPFLAGLLGDEVHGLLQGIEAAFDPERLLNPHKIVDALPVALDLRAPGNERAIRTYVDWNRSRSRSRKTGLAAAASKCNGAGVCLKRAGRGTICPSYRATREEKHGTRGRANLFRQVLEDPEPWTGMTAGMLREALDLCLSCKGCRS